MTRWISDGGRHFCRLFLFQESIGTVARQNKNLKKKNVRDKYKLALSLLDRLRRIEEDVSIALPGN